MDIKIVKMLQGVTNRDYQVIVPLNGPLYKVSFDVWHIFRSAM